MSTRESLFEHAGGHDALHRFIDIFCSSVLVDPLLQPLFGTGRPEHVAQLTAFDSESFGGPQEFTLLGDLGGPGPMRYFANGVQLGLG